MLYDSILRRILEEVKRVKKRGARQAGSIPGRAAKHAADAET
jgi:hypothetical protein